MKKSLLFIVISFISFHGIAQKTEVLFNVFLKDENIGQIKAIETNTGSTIIRDIQSATDARIFAFSIHVESDTKITKGNEIMTEGIAYRHANRGPEDVHATTKRVSNRKYECTRNDKKTFLENTEITFCVADLYFKEPKGMSKIYSNMWAKMVAVKNLGNGIYQVTAPDNKKSLYTYKNSKLTTIELDTPAGKVISKRK